MTHSGTDGNNHGIYFGANYLFNKTGKRPVVYVSDEAHYSNMRLCDLQNLEVRLIKSDAMGRMIPEELEKIGWPCWCNEYSNTVFFKRPSAEICRKYTLASGNDERFGGELAHVVVMQQVTKEKIDKFVKALKKQKKERKH